MTWVDGKSNMNELESKIKKHAQNEIKGDKEKPKRNKKSNEKKVKGRMTKEMFKRGRKKKSE